MSLFAGCESATPPPLALPREGNLPSNLLHMQMGSFCNRLRLPPTLSVSDTMTPNRSRM
jgi:hypothetical protein